MPTRHLAPRRKNWLTSICIGIAVALLAGSIQFMVIYHNRAERFDVIINNVHTYLQDYFHDLNQTIHGLPPLVDEPCENVASGLTAHAASAQTYAPSCWSKMASRFVPPLQAR